MITCPYLYAFNVTLITSFDYERSWEKYGDFWISLDTFQQQMLEYVDALAKIAGGKSQD